MGWAGAFQDQMAPSWHPGSPHTLCFVLGCGEGLVLAELSPAGQVLSPLEEIAHLVHTPH